MIIRKRNICNSLLYLLGLTMSLGSGVSDLIGIDLAKIFPILLCFLLLYTFFASKVKVKNIPKYYLYYIGFIAIHTILSYCLFFPDELFDLKISGEITMVSLIRFLLFIIYSIILIIQFDDFEKIKKFIVGYNVGFLLSLLVGIYMFLNSASIIEGAYRLAGGFSNSNAFGTSALQLIFMNLILYIKQNKKSKLFFFIILFVGLVSVLLSQSRGNILGLLMGFVYLFFTLKSLSGKRIYVMILAVCFSIITVFILPFGVMESLVSRFNIQERVEGNHESRLQIWGDYMSNLPKYFFQGYGRDRVTKVTKDHYTSKTNYATHNRYLNTLVEFGIIGLFLFGFMLRSIYCRLKVLTYYKKSYSIAKFSCAFLMTWCFIVFVSDYHNSRDFWLFIGLVISIINILRNEINKNGEKEYLDSKVCLRADRRY